VPTKSPMGHRGGSRCSFMAAFVPHAACLVASRVDIGAIMRCIHAHVFSLWARWEKFHACLPACVADRELYGRPRFVPPVNKKETTQK
jgi:hypothetical protein